MIASQFGLFEVAPFAPRFNIAPTQPVAVVRCPMQGAPTGRELVWLRWGLIPSWAKDPAVGNRLINARAETAAQKPAYRAAFRLRRCLVVADGFYEWQRTAGGRQPYFVHMRDHRPFAFAGLWESWQAPDRPAVQSCVLLTTQANQLIEPIHNRMPVILAEEDYQPWLDPAIRQPERLQGLLRPFDSQAMVAYPVDSYVNRTSHDDPRCIMPA